jgi:hypothetical protein
MSHKDLMKDWFKELPSEQPSPEFSVKVMQRVMLEWTSNPGRYQPLISRKAGWLIGLVALLLTSILFALQSSVTESADSASQIKSTYGIDFSGLITSIGHLFEKLNSISPAVAIGVLAIIALWFFDQLIVKTVKR